MTRSFLTTGYVEAVLEVDEPQAALAALASSITRQLPGGWRLRPESEAASVPTISIAATEQEPAITVLPEEPASVHARLPSPLASPTLPYVTYTALERQRQREGMVTLHATSARLPEGGAVLLLGDKGSGKTNTLLSLMRRGCVPAGDDLVVVHLHASGLDVLPGKRVAAVRYEPGEESALYYESKKQEALDRHNFAEQPLPISCIVRVNVNLAASRNTIQQSDGVSFSEALRLHENMGRYISGLPTPLRVEATGPEGPIWPVDSTACTRLRAKMVERFARVPFYYLQARTADEATKLILEETRNE